MAAPEFQPETGFPREALLAPASDLTPEIYPHNLGILDRVELGGPRKLDGLSEQRYLYTFSDGTSRYDPVHESRLYIPTARKKHSRGLISTVPWLTGLDGHHELLNQEAAANRVTSVAVSREVSSTFRALQHIGHTSLTREAVVQLLIHQDLAEDGHFMPEELTGTGYSLAGIILNGVAAYAHRHKTRLVHGEGLDPGPAKRLGTEELAPRALSTAAIRELAELWNVLRECDPEERKLLLKTFPVSIRHTLQNFNVFIALTATGEGGRLAAKVPQDTSMNMTFFKGFKFNQRKVYRHIFENHPNVRIYEEAGYHFSGAHEQWRQLLVGRTALVQRHLESGIPPGEIDHDEIHRAVSAKIAKNKSLRNL